MKHSNFVLSLAGTAGVGQQEAFQVVRRRYSGSGIGGRFLRW